MIIEITLVNFNCFVNCNLHIYFNLILIVLDRLLQFISKFYIYIRTNIFCLGPRHFYPVYRDRYRVSLLVGPYQVNLQGGNKKIFFVGKVDTHLKTLQ